MNYCRSKWFKKHIASCGTGHRAQGTGHGEKTQLFSFNSYNCPINSVFFIVIVQFNKLLKGFINLKISLLLSVIISAVPVISFIKSRLIPYVDLKPFTRSISAI